jgi:hypothetical protein
VKNILLFRALDAEQVCEIAFIFWKVRPRDQFFN